MIGFIYGLLIYYIRGYGVSDVEMLLQSFVFAMVFHKVILEEVEKLLRRQLGRFKNENKNEEGGDNGKQ